MSNYDPAEFGIGRLFHLTSEAIVIADLSSERIVLWNDAAQRIFGYSAADAVGMRLDALVPPELREKHLAGIRRFHASGEAHLVGAGPVDVPALSKSGDELFVSLSLTDVTPEGSEPKFIVAVLRDVTAQRRAEENLERANNSMKEIVATASHDLRNPLTVIEGFASLLVAHQDEFDQQQRREALESILSSVRHASLLVADLLELSKIQAGVITTRPAAVPVSDAARRAMKVANVRALNNVLSTVSVFADPDHLQRILVNYLSNAARYGALPISVEARRDHGWVEIEVRDAGDGPPPEFVDRLFTSFARAKETHHESVGLGLSIVRGLAEMNGGTAYFRREAGDTCFGVTLPDAPPAM